MRNGYIVQILTSVDTQKIVKTDGKKEIYEGFFVDEVLNYHH